MMEEKLEGKREREQKQKRDIAIEIENGKKERKTRTIVPLSCNVIQS